MHQGEAIRRFEAADFAAFGARAASGPLSAQGFERTFGQVRVTRMRGEPLELDGIGYDPDEETVDFVFLEEGALLYCEGGEWNRLDGSFLVIPNGLPRGVRLTDRWQILRVRVPREAMSSFVSELPTRVVPMSARALIDLSMHAFAATLFQIDRHATAIENYATEQLLMEMCGAILLDRLSGVGRGDGSPKDVLRDRAMAVIAQQCADVDLNPARVAREVQASLRQLQIVFAEIDTTVATEIRRRRVRLAHQLLTDSRFDVLSIDQIAERSGFGTSMSMRRALQETFGVGPRELRLTRGAAYASADAG